jgi:DNA-binding NarL/FixJ family response regulator
MAGEMGMDRLRERAYRELVLAGGRPRRVRATGPRSLTAAQQKVAQLAAAGRTNRQIAEDLFVTIKTVETHLATVYRKLGIATREELADVLGATDDEPLAAASASVSP